MDRKRNRIAKMLAAANEDSARRSLRLLKRDLRIYQTQIKAKSRARMRERPREWLYARNNTRHRKTRVQALPTYRRLCLISTTQKLPLTETAQLKDTTC